MSKRALFVFAGQSNMMGAATLPPEHKVVVNNSYEYRHKAKRLGLGEGEFVKAGYPCGEFSYTEDVLAAAYSAENTDEKGNSKLNNYRENTYFVPALCNIKNKETRETYPFDFFSESNANYGPCMAPIFAEEWEKMGQKCAYAHIAKGAVSILHYFNREMRAEFNRMATEYNEDHEGKIELVSPDFAMCSGASAYFDTKTKDFFADAEKRFEGDDTSERIFVWCQGEGGGATPIEKYKYKLEVLWAHMKELGFTKFFCVRIGNWGDGNKHDVMIAQEEFCKENDDCFMMTRAMSLMPNAHADSADWFVEQPSPKYEGCRALDFNNAHINEKGFMTVAEKLAENSYRVLVEQKEPILEKELVAAIVNRK